MSLKEEKDEGHPNQPVIPRKIQDELVYSIQTSLNNIATRVNNINKCAEDLFRQLSKEVDRISLKFNSLQERIIQLTDGVTDTDPDAELSLQDMKSRKTFQSTIIQTQQIYSFKPLSVKICEGYDACVQTSPLNMTTPYHQDDKDASYCFELCKEKIICESKEQKRRKCKQKKRHLDYSNEPENVSQSQLMEDEVLKHIPAACGEVTHSNVDEPAKSPLLATFPSSEISKITKAVGRVLSSPLCLPIREAGEMKNTLTYVNYGTGMGKKMQTQPRPRLKTEVFVSSTAPTSPPPLPPDWLALLRTSKMATPSSMKTSAATSPLVCLQSTRDTAVPITPPQAESSPSVPEISQSLWSPFLQLPRPSTAKSPRYSVPSTPRSLLLPPPTSSVSQLSRSLVPERPRSSAPQPQILSRPQTPRSLIPSAKVRSVAQSPRQSVAPSPRRLVFQSSPSPQSLSAPHLKPSPAFLPIITKTRSALLDTIRKGVLLHKIKGQCVPKAKMEVPKSGASSILICHKAMGYSSDKSTFEHVKKNFIS
uniref:WH2 domain-containing protein n=1 Tax=Loxodonta africana TaxID=9785 RepID=G3UIB7_LOXAF